MEKHIFKKKYGQNFLKNEIILDKIISSFECEKNTKIIEVGPGAGALTKKLVELQNDIIAFEIDEDLEENLSNIKKDNLRVVFTDFLKINLCEYLKSDEKFYVVANIPYYITTPIITKFIKEKYLPEEMILMVQKEVAERLSSKPKSSDYGAITVLLNYYFEIQYLFTVDRKEFFPSPNVDSAIIKLRKKKNMLNCEYDKFQKLVNDSFKQKRKTLKNNLKNYNLEKIEEALNRYNLSLSNRAEDLSYEIFVEIANFL